jgi:hypothetical protein
MISAPVLCELAAAGGVANRGDQDAEVAFADGCNGVDEADRCLAGETGNEPQHPLLPGGAGEFTSVRAAMAASQSIAAVPAPW